MSGQLRLVRQPQPPDDIDVHAITDVFNDAIDEAFAHALADDGVTTPVPIPTTPPPTTTSTSPTPVTTTPPPTSKQKEDETEQSDGETENSVSREREDVVRKKESPESGESIEGDIEDIIAHVEGDIEGETRDNSEEGDKPITTPSSTHEEQVETTAVVEATTPVATTPPPAEDEHGGGEDEDEEGGQEDEEQVEDRSKTEEEVEEDGKTETEEEAEEDGKDASKPGEEEGKETVQEDEDQDADEKKEESAYSRSKEECASGVFSVKGCCCEFPVDFRGETFEECIEIGHTTAWCYTDPSWSAECGEAPDSVAVRGHSRDLSLFTPSSLGQGHTRHDVEGGATRWWDHCEPPVVETHMGCQCQFPFEYKGSTHR